MSRLYRYNWAGPLTTKFVCTMCVLRSHGVNNHCDLFLASFILLSHHTFHSHIHTRQTINSPHHERPIHWATRKMTMHRTRNFNFAPSIFAVFRVILCVLTSFSEHVGTGFGLIFYEIPPFKLLHFFETLHRFFDIFRFVLIVMIHFGLFGYGKKRIRARKKHTHKKM